MEELTPEQLEAAEALLREKIEAEATEKAKAAVAIDNQELLEKMVAERLAKMKDNVDKAYGKVDELTKENLRLKEAEKEAAKKRMEEEGKHLELSQMRVTELEETIALQKEKLTALTRDQKVKDVLAGKDFRNDFARDMAFRTIVASLVEDEERGWIHKSGVSVEDYFDHFSKDPEHQLLFKQKDNSGAGTSPAKSAGGKKPDSLKGLSSKELLDLAATGQLGEFSLD